jgi:hypothetical protein
MFTEPDVWSGRGSIELLLMLGEISDAAVREVLRTAWEWPCLEGPYLSNSVEPETQSTPRLEDVDLGTTPILYGVADLPNGSSAAFASFHIRDENGAWIYLGVPLGSLGRVYSIGAFPFEGTPLDDWATEVYGWLAELARWVHRQATFRRAIIGWLTLIEVGELIDGCVPERRFHGYLIPSDGELKYLPPNVSEILIRRDDA